MSDVKHTHIAGPALAVITPAMSKRIGNRDFSVDVATLPDAACAYLLEYGYNQSLGDTKALSALEKVKAAVKAGILPEGFAEKLTTTDAAAALASYAAGTDGFAKDYEAWEATFLAERAQSRFDDIVSGDMVFGQTERLTPEEKDRRAIVLEMLKKALAGRGKKPAKDAAELKAQLDYVYNIKQAEVDKEVHELARKRAKRGDVDMSGLLG